MYQKRLLKLKNLLKKQRLDSLFISSPYHISYLTGASYFSIEEREAFLFVTHDKQYIFTDGRYTELVQKNVQNFILSEISSQTPLKKILQALAHKLPIKTIGIEEHNLTVSEYKMLSSVFKKIENTNLAYLRVVKDETEINNIKAACKLTDKTFSYILKKIKPEISEKQLAFEMEFFIKKEGADLAFKSIVAFGPHSSVPHHQTNDQRLKANDIILLDFGAKVHNYCSDMTRTIFVGKVPDKIKKMYTTTLAAQQKAIDYIDRLVKQKADIKTSDIDTVARSYIESQDFPTIPHSLGHGVGLEVHEAPRLSPVSKETLKNDMVFTIEPGIYIPGLGGIRIEDTVLLEKDKLQILTKSSKEIIELD